MIRALPVLLLVTLPACMNEYHPEYHPETVYTYVQTVKVEEPKPPPPTTVVIVMAAPLPQVASAPPRRKAVVAQPASTFLLVAPAPTFQAAPAFVADDAHSQ